VAELLEKARVEKAEQAEEEAESDAEINPADMELTRTEKETIAESVVDDRDDSMWETYNDVTEAVWHSGNTSDTTKRRKYKKLHRVMPPADGVR